MSPEEAHKLGLHETRDCRCAICERDDIIDKLMSALRWASYEVTGAGKPLNTFGRFAQHAEAFALIGVEPYAEDLEPSRSSEELRALYDSTGFAGMNLNEIHKIGTDTTELFDTETMKAALAEWRRRELARIALIMG